MLARLVEWSLAQRVLVFAATAALVVGGVLAWRALPIDAYPDIAPTQVKLILKAPGMTPEEVESRVITPLELELLGLPRASVLRSVAKYAVADITIDFEEGTDIYWARQQVTERFAAAQDELPRGVAGGLAPIATPLSDMLMFTIEGGGLSLAERRSLLDWTLRPALRTIPGVADVNALGGEVTSYAVIPDRNRLAAAGIGFRELAEVLARNNSNDGAGRLEAGDLSLIVRTEGALRTPEDLARIVIAHDRGRLLRVGDVAQVRVDALTRYGAVTRDGHGEAVEGIVVALRGADAGRLVRAVRERLAQLAPGLPPGVRVDIFYDRSALIERAVGTVRSALVEATVLVVLLLFVFLGEVRAAVVVALILPLAALFTFLAMRLTGMSANLMSLGGLAVAVGMLVDAGVVVVENTVSRLHPHAADASAPRLQRIGAAVREVAVPVAAGILVIGLVFLPLLTLQDLEGRLFRPVALTIVFALAGSLVLSLSFVPVLASLLLKERPHAEPWLMRRLDGLYRPLLERSLRRPRLLYAAAAASLVVGLGTYLAIGKSFMPTMDEGDLIMQVVKLPSVSLAHSRDLDLALERELLAKVPEVEHAVGRLGSDELGLDPMGLNDTDLFLQLKPRSQWRQRDKDWLAAQLRQVADRFPGLEVGFTQPIEMRVAEMLTGSRGDVAIKIFGSDLATLAELGQRVATIVGKLEGAQDVIAQSEEGMQFLQVAIDAQAAGRGGFDIASIQDELRAQLEGLPAGQVILPGRRIPLLVRGDAALRGDGESFARLPLVGDAGSVLPLDQLARLTATTGPVRVDHENGSRFVLVQAGVAGRDLVGFVDEARRAVAGGLALPAGYRIEWGGQFENQQRAAARLGLVVPLALGLIFLVLFLTFGSLRQALLVLGNIPFALVGGIVALWLSGQYLSVPASIGFIALLGIAVLNGLVLITCFNQLRAAGMPVEQVVREGARRRLRPVLMTASITAFGLVPLLFATGPGSEVQRPLAVVVIGGLITSTALTLIVLPILFRRFGLSRA
ncbi:MAG: efflux RND transporter permease subunit [Dokdonella sp.]|nr:efflux RND transporter permease subunit [Dokdonella sp.]